MMQTVETGVKSSRLALWLWLAGPGGILVCAHLMRVGGGRGVSLPWIGRLPETCAMRTQLGMDCPGCGLTRTFVHLAHGDFISGWELSPVGLLVFSFVVLQIPLALLHLLRVEGTCVNVWTEANQFALVALLVALASQWVWRLLNGGLI